jgi:hypothetical protein
MSYITLMIKEDTRMRSRALDIRLHAVHVDAK